MGLRIKWDENLTSKVAEAVEKLSEIADLPLDGEINSGNPSTPINEIQSTDWNQNPVPPNEILNTGREMFRVILNYLQSYYKNESGYAAGTPKAEHVKTIMTLVGDAAKKLDKYTALFNKHRGRSATESHEYKRLQHFYQEKISHHIDESILGKWILALYQIPPKTDLPKLTAHPSADESKVEHVFVDLEAVKRDLEYELFFIRKADGTRFFHPRLLRNLKLICDFAARGEGTDPLSEIDLWIDRYYQGAAKAILDSLHVQVDHFYQRALKCKESELVMLLNKAIMALMLCSYPENRIKDLPSKNCRDYFIDFQNFLNELLQCQDYHKFITYPPNQTQGWRHSLLSLTHALCRALYTSLNCFQMFNKELHDLISQAHLGEKDEERIGVANTVSAALQKDYQAMVKLFKRHPNGGMGKIIDALTINSGRGFDPMNQGNLPNVLYRMEMHDCNTAIVHLPSPTTQEYIHKASVLEVFRGFLRSCAQGTKDKHLMINLQDRTNWREHARCTALEGMMSHGDFNHVLSVVTIPKENEFYDQLAPYDRDHRAEDFIEHFKEQLKGGNSGYYFPAEVSREMEDFIPKALQGVHMMFFGGRNTLPQSSRLDFIEIFDLMIILKLHQLVKPTSLSLTCKDGVDIGTGCSALLYVLQKMLQGESFTENDYETIASILYAAPILVRERLISSERFQRMLSALKTIELAYQEYGSVEFAKRGHAIIS